jgi:hypothetical protein
MAFLVGLLVTGAVVAGAAVAWPQDDAPAEVLADQPSTTLMTKEAAEGFVPAGPSGAPTPTTVAPARLFEGGFLPAAFADLASAIDDGGTARLFELLVYPDRVSAAFVPPKHPDAIDEVTWRADGTSEAQANTIDDRVDADTAPKLFDRTDVDLSLIARLVADAPSRYSIPVTVTHVIIDRFLPFDQRVLVRVYASPTDGRSGGGYVRYQAADGAYVATCC